MTSVIVALCAFALVLPAHMALALDAPEATQSSNDSDAQTAKVTIDSSTAVVTSTSGYHLSATLENTGNDSIPEGTLSVAVNDYYTFGSRADMQQWAQGSSRIQVPNQLGQVAVPQIDKGGKITVAIDANPDQPSLKNIISWGAKPVRITYAFPVNASNGNANAASSRTSTTITVHTFLTRSSDGLNNASTPPMNITMVIPLASEGWQIDDNKLGQLMTTGEGDGSKIVNAGKLPQAADQLISKHDGLQVITDPTLAQNLAIPPKSSAIMQPGAFDITAYSAVNNESAYEKAGVSAKTWNAETSMQQFRSAVGDTKAAPTTYAWPGRGQWTMSSLETARRQGYTTVIAPDIAGMGSNNASSTVRTGKYTIHTDAGEVTMLMAQGELSRLAQGKPTDKLVDGESSAAGRLARFMAQSAFYQMESPYATRNLLICFDTDAVNSDGSVKDADALMTAVEQAPWLKLSNLDELNQSKAYLSGEKAANIMPDSANIHDSTIAQIRQSLATLASNKNDIDRFSTSILDESSTKAPAKSGTSATQPDQNKSSMGSSPNSDTKSESSADSSNPGKPNNASPSSPQNDADNNHKTDTGDAQALARQDANITAKRSKNGHDWLLTIADLQRSAALHALSSSNAVSKRMSAGSQDIASQLMNGVSITPSESITVLSETAKMPVTVKNDHPYPVNIKVSSLTDSMEIVTTRFETLSVPARSEAQTTFDVRVATSGTATAHLTLTDRKGDAFSKQESTRIASTLRISDMSGLIFIVAAIILGMLGIWRQFNRKKDPDE
ncbi:DUF6049 family protein [Bifidobacterium commune]|uniref:DUF6049 family protein n=1 Tax=Bifidobacterium commune TaxID=1505727 RepID=UPI000A628446|nr:DUF6049 family protein [Bifidobacterium commune]